MAVAGLNIIVQNNTSTERQRTSTKTSKLDVAIVNEDQSVESENTVYALGSSYIKTIERDDSHNWSVVGRGTAETGLKNGDYQLIIFIPNDFSKKILDINNINVEQTIVTYKINSKGNLQVESEANKVGKDIISDLNAQLVDMYMASILSNLYTAQENVQTIANTQNNNINNYRINLYDSAVSFQNIFPSLVGISNSSITANKGLTEVLNTSNTFYETMLTSQNAFRTNLDDLIAKRSQDQMTYSDFTAALFSMNNDILSNDTTLLFDRLKTEQTQLTSLLGSAGTGDIASQGYQHSLSQLDAQIGELETLMENEKKKLEEQLTAVHTYVEEAVTKYYGQSITDITLSSVLNKNKDTRVASEDYQAKMKQVFQSAVSKLPSIDSSVLTPYLDEISAPKIDYNAQAIISGEYGSATNGELLSRIQSTYENFKKLKSEEVEFKTTDPTPTNGTVTVYETDNAAIVKDWSLTSNGVTSTYKPGALAQVDFSKDYSVRVTYEYTPTVVNTVAPASPTVSDSVDGEENDSTVAVAQDSAVSTQTIGNVIIEAKKGETVTQSSFNYLDFVQAGIDYASAIQEAITAYNIVGSLLDHYQTATGDLTSDFLNTSMTESIKELLTLSIIDNLNAYKSLVEQDTALSEQLTMLKTSRDDLMAQFTNIQTTNTSLANQIEEQLVTLENLRQKANSLNELQTTNNTAQEATDTNISTLGEELKSLLSSTSSLQENSRTNTEEVNQVNAIFENFNKEVESAQAIGQDLSADATSLMTQFDDELTQSKDFVGSFVKVLNNAYSNGVPNEVLLDFLSNPVGEKTSSIKATVDVYRPFTWILLLEVVTLFTAYLFATQDLVKKVRDKFKVSRFEDADLLNVIILSFLSFVIGITLGVVSSNRLGIESEYVPSWVLLIVLFAFLLVHAQYFILKYFKAVGMGLILFTIISFVYLSNAIGTTATLTGLPAVLKDINPLSILETRLSAYFDGITVSWVTIVLTILFTVGFGSGNAFMNLFVKTRVSEE